MPAKDDEENGKILIGHNISIHTINSIFAPMEPKMQFNLIEKVSVTKSS